MPAARPQCADDRDLGFTLHGLWPQNERGWPSFCRTSYRDPTRQQTRAMADIMGTSGLAWHQWKKHGRCSGLSSEEFFSLSRKAYETINRPEILRRIDKELELAPKVIESAFIEENHELKPDQITITCKSGTIQEVRICLTRDLDFRTCGTDAIRDCTNETIDFPPIQ